MARMNISVPDELYERYKRLEERLNASRVCAEALERELDVMEGVGTGEVAVEAMVERLMGAQERSYSWGYADGRSWGLAHASRADLKTARELKDYSGSELLLDPIEPEESEEDHEYNAALPHHELPGLCETTLMVQSHRLMAEREMDKHREKGDEQGDVEAYAEGWRDALADLYGVLRKAEKTPRTRVPHAFRQAMDS